MRAVVIEDRGSTKEFAFRDIEAPEPGADDLLIAVRTSSLNQADLRRASSHFAGSEGNAVAVAGLELAGEVVAVGSSVVGFSVGDRVMAMSGGAWAELAVVDHRLALPVPADFSWAEAAASSISYVTGFDALVRAGGLQHGMSVLVQGGTSSAGLAVVQLAQQLGAAKVLATTGSEHKLDALRDLGCTPVLRQESGTITDQVHDITAGGADLVIDVIGGDAVDDNVQCAALAGRIVCLGRLGGTQGSINLDEFSRRRVTMVGVTFRTRSLEERFAVVRSFRDSVSPLLEEGRPRPLIDEVLPLTAVSNADELLGDRSRIGKLILEVS